MVSERLNFFGNIRSARGNIPVRVRRRVVAIEVEETGIRTIVTITAGVDSTHQHRAKREPSIDTKSLFDAFRFILLFSIQ